MLDKYLVIFLFNICTLVLAYLFRGWMKEAWKFIWSDLNAKAEYCEKNKPFGLWRAFNRIVMTLVIWKWAVTCAAIDVHMIYSLITGTNPFG